MFGGVEVSRVSWPCTKIGGVSKLTASPDDPPPPMFLVTALSDFLCDLGSSLAGTLSHTRNVPSDPAVATTASGPLRMPLHTRRNGAALLGVGVARSVQLVMCTLRRTPQPPGEQQGAVDHRPKQSRASAARAAGPTRATGYIRTSVHGPIHQLGHERAAEGVGGGSPSFPEMLLTQPPPGTPDHPGGPGSHPPPIPVPVGWRQWTASPPQCARHRAAAPPPASRV